jgi:hypothetical protein
MNSLNVGGTAQLGANVSSTGTQTYNGAVTVSANSTLTNGGLVKFLSTVQSGATKSLTVTGNAEFDGTVGGGGNQLASLTVNGVTTINTNSIITNGSQTYNGNVGLNVGTDLTGSTVTFGAALNGTFGLTVSGNAVFDGNVGGTNVLSSLNVANNTTIAGGVAIRTSGTQTYGDTVTLNGSAVMQSNGNKLITIDGSLNGRTGNENLTVTTNSGGVSLLGGANQINTLTLNESNTLTLRGVFGIATLDTSGISGRVALAGNTQLNLGSDLHFTNLTGGITGGHAFNIVDSGNTVDLSNVKLSVGSVKMSAATLMLANVTTAQGQSYTGALTLSGNTLDNTTSGDISVNGRLIVANKVGITNGGGGIDLSGAVDGNAAGRGLTLRATDAVTLDGAVGARTALGSLSVTGKTISLQAVTTSGDQTYNGSATVNADLSGQGLAFSRAVNIATPVLLTADAIDFGGGSGSVKGATTLAIVTRTADLGITVGTGSSGLVLNAGALQGYAGLLYIGAVPKTGGVSTGVFGVSDTPAGQLGGNITVNAPLRLANGGTLILVSGKNITLTGNANDMISAGTVVLAASGNLEDTGGSAGITADTIVLAGNQIGTSAADSIAVFPLGGTQPTLQIGSGNSTSNIGGENIVFSEQQGSSATEASTYDTDVGVTAVNSNITNASQQSATNQQTGGLLGSGFIDVSVFQQISLYDVNGSGIQLPGDQCEEESASGTGCGR